MYLIIILSFVAAKNNFEGKTLQRKFFKIIFISTLRNFEKLLYNNKSKINP